MHLALQPILLVERTASRVDDSPIQWLRLEPRAMDGNLCVCVSVSGDSCWSGRNQQHSCWFVSQRTETGRSRHLRSRHVRSRHVLFVFQRTETTMPLDLDPARLGGGEPAPRGARHRLPACACAPAAAACHRLSGRRSPAASRTQCTVITAYQSHEPRSRARGSDRARPDPWRPGSVPGPGSMSLQVRARGGRVARPHPTSGCRNPSRGV